MNPDEAKTTIRAFIAIDLPPEIRAMLSEQINQMKQKISGGISWVKGANIHLTLKFLGQIETSKTTEIAEKCAPLCAGHDSFELTLTHTGAYPNIKHPRVLWMGVQDQSAALSQMQNEIERCCEEMGFEPEKRAYSPHLTLARIRSKKKIPGIDDIITAPAPYAGRPFKVDAVHLFSSQLRPQGPVYKKERSFALKGYENREIL